MRALWSLVVAVLVLCTTTVSLAGTRALSAKEIRTLISGATVEGKHLKENYSFRRQYDADGSFTQEKNAKYAEREGRWSFKGSQLCIQWNGESRKLCRVMETDQKGSFWKMLKKRNGRRVKIVTYRSFVDAKGKDLTRKIKKRRGSKKKRSDAPSGAVIVLLVVGGLTGFTAFLVIGFLYLMGANDPNSIRHKLLSRSVKAGGESHSRSKLHTLDAATLDRFGWACMNEKNVMGSCFVFIAIAKQTGNSVEAWRRIFHLSTNVPDDDVVAVLEIAIDLAELSPLPTAAVTPNFRGCYLLGQTLMKRANKYQTSNESKFTSNKDHAAQLFGFIRTQSAAPAPNMYTPYRGGGATPDYISLAGPACEAAMYLKWVAPVVSTGSSSAHSGGG
jgi:hypothetical protein